MEEFKREDYIYLRYLEDDKDANKKKGNIVRYKKDWLIERLKGRRFNTCFNSDSLSWEENPDADENEVEFNKIYKSITVSDNWRGEVYLWKDDYLYLDEWLFSHMSTYDADLVKGLKKEILPNLKGDNKMVMLKEGCPNVDARIKMCFEKGEIIDFSNPSVVALFYNPYFFKILAKTEVIVGENKEKLFQDDFSNAINVEAVDDYALDITKEHHYFKMKDNIKVKTDDEVTKLLGMSYLNDIKINLVRNEQGFITHICTVTNNYDSSDREMEQIILKIANRISSDEAMEIHKKACLDYVERQNAEQAKFMEEYKRKQKKFDDIYQTKKNNPEIFPGVNGDFVHIDKDSITKKKHTLKQIQEFYQNLKTLDPEIVKHICFYGGTIPYILNNASESRDFGDIDMFVPTEYMEKLRAEFAKQESFEILCDSKPYAEACMLTTRIAKDSTELALKNQQVDTLSSVASSLFDSLMNFMTPSEYKKDYVDANGIVHNPLSVHKEEQLSYYRKIQDFGFKAKLFGINISVFPIYEYKNNLIAKSFNINEMYRFLLGVKVLNNTKLAEFIQQVNVYGSIFNVLPLEYTLASKQSAVEGNYAFRYEKDKEDIKYILSHKDELGISDEKLQEILKNYPDYSISIAYEINGNQVTTMDGEAYKKRVLTNRQVS